MWPGTATKGSKPFQNVSLPRNNRRKVFYMGIIIDLGLAPPHDPMFGISSSNIVSYLTPKNWRKKAIGRTKHGRFLYVLVQLGRREVDGKKQKRYYARVHLGLPEDRSLNADFEKLTDALAYANGEEGSALASSTQIGSPDQMPEERSADTTRYQNGSGQ